MEIYENIFTKDECNYLINLIKDSYNLHDFLIYNPEKKIKTVIPEYSQRKGINFFDERLGFVEDRFIKLSNQTVSDVEYNKIDLYRFNQYGEGEFINYHEDFDAMSKGAIITMALFLNNEYEGGEFWFNENGSEYKIDQKIGSVAIFQSGITHKITPVTQGTRYSINCWPKYKKINKTLF